MWKLWICFSREISLILRGRMERQKFLWMKASLLYHTLWMKAWLSLVQLLMMVTFQGWSLIFYSLRASSPLEGVARSHARAARERRREFASSRVLPRWPWMARPRTPIASYTPPSFFPYANCHLRENGAEISIQWILDNHAVIVQDSPISLQATRGARKPNLQVTVTHARHVCSRVDLH